MSQKTVRWQVFFSGRVQGVGFRYTVNDIAQPLELVGYVRNLDDGRVELLVEGQPAVLRQLLERILAARVGNIEHHQLLEAPAQGGLEPFRIRR